jgi:hypothetical protein
MYSPVLSCLGVEEQPGAIVARARAIEEANSRLLDMVGYSRGPVLSSGFRCRGRPRSRRRQTRSLEPL